MVLIEQIKNFVSEVLGVVRNAKITLTDGATVTWSIASSRKAQVTLGGNRTLAITNVVDGDQGAILVIQDATGSRTLSAPANSRLIGAGPITSFPLSTGANSRDILTFWLDGTTYYWNIGRGY